VQGIRQYWGWVVFATFLLVLWVALLMSAPVVGLLLLAFAGAFFGGMRIGYKGARDADVEAFIGWATQRREPPDDHGPNARVG